MHRFAIKGSARRLLGTLLLALAGALLAIGAAALMFSTYMFYDDEGYVLFSVKNYSEHGRLYSDVYSQYGPAPYVFYDVLHRFAGFPFTHEAGRFLTLGCWLGAAALGAALVRSVTGSITAALFTLATTVPYLWPMISEPIHPGGLIVAMTSIAALIGARLIWSGRIAAFSAMTGAIAGFLLLTKINTGVFFLLSAGAFAICFAAGEAWRRRGRLILLPGLVAFPFLLMASLLSRPWIATYAALFALAAVCTVSVVYRIGASASPATQIRRKHLMAFGGALMFVIGLVLAGVMLRGTSLLDVFEGVILGPLRHPGAFSLPTRWSPFALLCGLTSALLYIWLQRRTAAGRAPFADGLIVVLRGAVLLGLVALVFRFPVESPDHIVFSYLPAVLWILVWPLDRRTDRREPQLRAWIALVLLGQYLHPFPVAGSQISWGTFLVLPLFALSWIEAAQWLRARRRSWRRLAAGSAVLLAVASAWYINVVVGFTARLRNTEPLNLRGAERISLPTGTVGTYQALVTNARHHADVLFSMPGMFSFNLWSGRPAPTHFNVTHWFSLLSESRQNEIIGVLAREPRSAIVSHREHLQYLADNGYPPRGPLADYIKREMPVALRIDDFEFRVHRKRKIAPFLTGAFLRLPSDASRAHSVPDGQFVLTLPPLPGRTIAGFEVAALRAKGGERLLLATANALYEVTPIDSRGAPTGPARRVTLPFTCDGPMILTIDFVTNGWLLDLSNPAILTKDAQGQTIAVVRLVE